MRTADVIDIDDLARPRLSAAQRRARDAVDGTVPSARDILASAVAATGLDDFGADDFVPRLELWLAEAKRDTGLSAFGRAGIVQDAQRLAANRLRVEAAFRRYPEIAAVEIDRPIVIAGLPRSGTTNLVNLLAADRRLRSMPLWETMAPVPDRLPPPPRDDDPRRGETARHWGAFEELLPHMRAMHEMSADHVHEDIELQRIDFSSYLLDWVCRCPNWRDHYLASDQTPHYRYGRRVLQLLTWLHGPRRWVLKSPQHMEQLGPLRTVFPDATLIVTHRDPLAVIQSLVTMVSYGDRLRRIDVDPAGTAAYWIDRVETILRRCLRDRALWPSEVSMDAMFHRTMADPGAVLAQIYALAGLPIDDAARAAHRAYEQSHPRGLNGRVAYHLARDFGVDIAALRSRFSFYFDAVPIAEEQL